MSRFAGPWLRPQVEEDARMRLEQSLSEERAAERSTHRDLEQVRTYRSRAQRALEQGLGDPEAAQRQLDQTSAQIDDLETALLERLEAQEECFQLWRDWWRKQQPTTP